MSLLILSAVLAAETPRCGSDSEAAAFFTGRNLLVAAPPSGPKGLPGNWSIERQGEIVVMRDMTGDAYGTKKGLDYQGMYDALQQFYTWAPDDYDFLTVLTHEESSDTMGALAFYSPLSNDVEGIGDRQYSSGMRLQGLMFMNTWEYWSGQSDVWTSAVFGQELGHRWGSYVHFDTGEGDSNEILGRSQGHWSYWLHTGNSPMEGNAWTDNEDGTFTVRPNVEVDYSDLDLYLMGLLAPEDVEPFFLIQDPSGVNRSASSAPEYFSTGQSLTASGVRLDLGVEDIVRAEGEREPAAGESPTDFTMAVVLVLSSKESPDQDLFDDVNQVAERFARVWQEDTRELATLDISLGELHLPPPERGELTELVLVPRDAW